ncbi:MAG: glycosyltransferase, partial [bacterium]
VYEGLPVSLLEAMAMGRPTVATRVGGVPEVIASGETGVLVEPGDANGLAEGILSLLSDPDRRRRMGEAARLHVTQRRGVAQMVDAVEDVYRQVGAR